LIIILQELGVNWPGPRDRSTHSSWTAGQKKSVINTR